MKRKGHDGGSGVKSILIEIFFFVHTFSGSAALICEPSMASRAWRHVVQFLSFGFKLLTKNHDWKGEILHKTVSSIAQRMKATKVMEIWDLACLRSNRATSDEFWYFKEIKGTRPTAYFVVLCNVNSNVVKWNLMKAWWWHNFDACFDDLIASWLQLSIVYERLDLLFV